MLSVSQGLREYNPLFSFAYPCNKKRKKEILQHNTDYVVLGGIYL